MNSLPFFHPDISRILQKDYGLPLVILEDFELLPSEYKMDVCEAYSCIAHDWGDYELQTFLDKIGYKPSPLLKSDKLEGLPLEIYQELDRLYDLRYNSKY